MADTGSEIAEGTTRSTTGAVGRMLERRFLMRGPSGAGRGGGVPQGDVEIGVRCPKDDLDRRAEELLEAMERMGVRATCAIDDGLSEVTLGVPRGSADRALRALERLSASGRGAASLGDVRNLGALEELAGRRAIGRGAGRRDAPAATGAGAAAVESVALTFANHPEAPSLDGRQAESYAERMRGLGFDAAHRTLAAVRRAPDGSLAKGPAEVVGVSYLARDRDDFLSASAVALHECGAAGPDDALAHGGAPLASERARLMAGAEARRESFARNRDVAAGEYAAMRPRERARVAPERVPDAAYGSQGVAEAAREQAAAARALDGSRAPSRTHPAIGGR